MSAIRIRSVTKTYGQHTAVSDLSLNVPEGSLYGFIGPNGSGKTTTIRLILRIIQPDKGEIELLGTTVGRAANDALGYLPEERGLYKKMSVRRMLNYYASLKGMSSVDSRHAIAGWLERFDLTPWASKKVEALSKGMTQKVQFIASVVARPKVLILDEPFSGLDPVNTEVIRSAILELQKQGTTVIFSTHDMSVAEKMCDFIFMIYRGRKVLDGSLQELKNQYGADSVRLRIDHGSDLLSAIPEVKRVIDMGGYQEVQVEGDPQKLLHRLSSETTIQLFEVTQPSLHDIFIRIAAPEVAIPDELENGRE